MANPIVTTASRSWTQVTTLASVLKAITVASGYLTDIGNNVWTTDHQREQATDALGLMIYSSQISGPGIDKERPAKPVREFELFVECAIETDLDTAQQLIHDVIEDVETCITAYAKAQFGKPNVPTTPLHVHTIQILDRPEGAAAIVAVFTVVARYFR